MEYIPHNRDPENVREMLYKMRSEAGDVINELGRGAFWCLFEIRVVTPLSSDVLGAMHGSLLGGM